MTQMDPARMDPTEMDRRAEQVQWAARAAAVVALVSTATGPGGLQSVATGLFLFVLAGAAPCLRVWSRHDLGPPALLPGLVLVVSTATASVLLQVLVWGPGLSAARLIVLVWAASELSEAVLRRRAPEPSVTTPRPAASSSEQPG